MRSRLSKMIAVFTIALILIVGLQVSLTTVKAAQGHDRPDSLPPVLYRPPQTGPPVNFSIISDTISQNWAGIAGNCIAYRDANGGVFLHNLTTSETITITDKPDNAGKVVISQGIVVWRSERVDAGERGLWGYYNPDCSDTHIFGEGEIGPFYIITRPNSIAPALDGEMLTFDTRYPWQIHLIELDSNNNNLPDAIEDWYDPGDDTFPIQISCCQGGPNGSFFQRLSDIYWDNDYKIACWSSTSTFNLPTKLVCNDLHHYQEPQPWTYQFQVNDDTNIAPYDFGGIIAIHRDLVVWTGSREANLSGYDLYIADLDVDDDGILNHEDDDFDDEPFEFVLVNRATNQEYPDIWWPFVVWTDYRDGGMPEIYAYDLSLDSDGDGIENWRDPNRACIDPAEMRVTVDPALQQMPEIYAGTVIWEDWRSGDGDLYGATLQPVQPQPGQGISGATAEKAAYWLDKQTIRYATVNEIPKYVAATGMITRYKSFTQAGEIRVRYGWYEAITGTYTVGFDFCHFGTSDQQRFLGRSGRGFTYDQALTLIVRSMLSQPDQAIELGRHISSLQNSDQLTFTTPGSFGFSFNGQGYWGEKDNFYDMDYLRGGANGWLGYGYLFYADHYNDMQFMAVMTGVAEYILSLQVLDPITDARYGLFKGGYGRWSHEPPDEFVDGEVDWISAEHNIDIYFFLRDLGQLTGNSRYIEAADLQKENMIKLWNEKAGRFNQGMGPDGELDVFDALDAASWGAMYWIAVGDLSKAKRSLAYADQVYSNTVTVSNTVTTSPEITIWGYKPYTGFDGVIDWTDLDLVWSEGSLGVAMANLKLGHALLNQCNDLRGYTYIQQAEAIISEMEKLQTLDPDGGLFYAAYPDYPGFLSGVIPDFARAPSAAGTTWFLMVKQAMADETWRDAFWGPDEEFDILACPLQDVVITGPMIGSINTPYTFTATIDPISTTLPVTYIWQAMGQDEPFTHTSGLSDSVSFMWVTSGTQMITVTAVYTGDAATDSYSITIDALPPSSTIVDPVAGQNLSGTTYAVQGTALDSASGVAKVEVSTDGSASWQVTTGTTSWIYFWLLPDDGVYTLLSRATDQVGHLEGPTSGVTVTVDNTPPTVTIVSPQNGEVISTTVYTISGTAGDNLSGIDVVEISTDNGTSWSQAAGTADWHYVWTISDEDNEIYLLQSRVRDLANHQNSTSAVTVTVDNVRPTSSVTNLTEGQVLTGTVYTIMGTAADGSGIARVEVSTDGGVSWQAATGTTSWTYLWSISACGTYTVRTRAIDNAQNVEIPGAGVIVKTKYCSYLPLVFKSP